MYDRGTHSSYKSQQLIGYESGAVGAETGDRRDRRQYTWTRNKRPE